MMLREDPAYIAAMNEGPLYNSNKAAPVVQPVQRTFQPLSPVEIEIAEHSTKVIPVNEQIGTGNDLFTPQTVIPYKVVTNATPVPQAQPILKIDIERLIKTYPADTATSIVNDIKQNNPLPPKIAEQLVTSNIVQEKKNVEINKEVVLSTAPVIEAEATAVSGTVKPVAKKGFFDSLTNVVYNFLYKSNKK